MPPNTTNNQDISGVTGVFAGWTASDLVGSPMSVAEMTWNIYGPTPTILPSAYAKMMAETALERDYGLATFNLDRDTGQSGDYGKVCNIFFHQIVHLIMLVHVAGSHQQL